MPGDECRVTSYVAGPTGRTRTIREGRAVALSCFNAPAPLMADLAVDGEVERWCLDSPVDHRWERSCRLSHRQLGWRGNQLLRLPGATTRPWRPGVEFCIDSPWFQVSR
jgi:hypothetical protein